MPTNKTSKPAPEESTAIATYGEWTPEQMEKESSEMSSGGDFWKPPVGNTAVRLLPPKIGWPSPFVIQHQHFIQIPGNANKVIFSCSKMHEGKKCLPCAKADALEASGNSRDERAAKGLRPQRRMMCNAIVSPKKVEGNKPVIWVFGKTVYDQLKAIRENEEAGGNFLDPVKGFNIVIQRVGTGKEDTKYTLLPSRNQTPLGNMDWIDVQMDLRKLIRLPTVDQQKRLIDGEDPRDVWGDAKSDRAHGSDRRVDDASDLDTGAIDADSTEVKEKKRTAEDDLFDDEVDLD